RGGDHLLTAIMAVLAQLGDQDARPPALATGESVGHCPYLLDLVRHPSGFRSVDARNRPGLRGMPAEGLLHGGADLADRGHRTGRFDRMREQIALTGPGASG